MLIIHQHNKPNKCAKAEWEKDGRQMITSTEPACTKQQSVKQTDFIVGFANRKLSKCIYHKKLVQRLGNCLWRGVNYTLKRTSSWQYSYLRRDLHVCQVLPARNQSSWTNNLREHMKPPKKK